MKRKESIPRKVKNMIDDVMIVDNEKVIYSFRIRIRRYPRPYWVMKREKGIKKIWIEI